MIKPCAIDFETLPIRKRPDYPPKPVGVSITWPSGKSEYLAWGHPADNNCTKTEAKRILKDIYSSYQPVCHNGKFDLEVAEKHFNLPLQPKNDWHDSMLLAFLFNPRTWSLKLKDLADEHLNMPPVEQAKLNDWIIAHVFTSKKGGEGEVVIRDEKPKGFFKVPPSKTGMFICYAPVKLAGKYAKGDTIRTMKLYKMFMKYVKDNGLVEQYNIEKRVALESIKMERVGISIDTKELKPELDKATKTKAKHERALIKRVGDINFNSPKQIVEAFNAKGLVDDWEYTDKGNERTGVDSLIKVCTDKTLVKHLDYFSKYGKLIGTYMQPWYDSAVENDGKMFPWFNTIKGDNDKGTYTGRFSSNFQQVPRKPLPDYKTLPFLRNFIIPDKKNHLLFNRDFCGQELRILAHFGDGVFLAAYVDNPDLDGHEFVRALVEDATGVDYPRSYIKGCNFLMVYGGGANALSNTLHISLAEAKEVMKAHGAALPEVKELKGELAELDRHDELFKTAGGRYYDFERNFEYVALNTLIQGSAADHSKRSMLNIIDMLEAEEHDARLILTVHDEFMLSGGKRSKKKLMTDFKEAMEIDHLFDVPMLTDGKIGSRWGSMEAVK